MDPDFDDRSSGLDINYFNLHRNCDSPQSVVNSSHKPAFVAESVSDDDEEEGPTCFVQFIGHELGPLTQVEIVDMARGGSLTRGDRIEKALKDSGLP